MSSDTPDEKMQAMKLDEEGPKVKRDALRANEIEIQKMWEEQHAFESEPDDREHFLVTFPYRAYYSPALVVSTLSNCKFQLDLTFLPPLFFCSLFEWTFAHWTCVFTYQSCLSSAV